MSFSNRGFQVKCHLPTEKWGQNIQVDNGQFWKKPYIDVAVMLLQWRGWLKVPHAGIRSWKEQVQISKPTGKKIS